ncbi:hypothetical protein ETAA8_07510 [Anatilimnocola aggregata]|uniref:Uncharacterized protein n=1 Tax=Anatilimnocola aggregata TaxID=2528021 RepID=A0A517Y621_9BACT|nr:hypothetical protein ETAA8_07510 [Anatilimnocola aggregata]
MAGTVAVRLLTPTYSSECRGVGGGKCNEARFAYDKVELNNLASFDEQVGEALELAAFPATLVVGVAGDER